MPEVITARNLTKHYGATAAVDGLELHVRQGEFFGFLGPNGAGKTTTIRLLTGIVHPDGGDILVNGFSIEDKEQIAQAIGVVPESRGFYEWMTGAEYLYFFAKLYGISALKKVATLLEQVGLTAQQNKKVGAYSRGMRQRLGIARALINSPRILFLDEPTLGLDPQGQKDIQNLLRSLNLEGITIFYSSHLLSEVSELCSRIAILNKGKLIAEGTLDELRQRINRKDSTLTDIFLAFTQT